MSKNSWRLHPNAGIPLGRLCCQIGQCLNRLRVAVISTSSTNRSSCGANLAVAHSWSHVSLSIAHRSHDGLHMALDPWKIESATHYYIESVIRKYIHTARKIASWAATRSWQVSSKSVQLTAFLTRERKGSWRKRKGNLFEARHFGRCVCLSGNRVSLDPSSAFMNA